MRPRRGAEFWTGRDADPDPRPQDAYNPAMTTQAFVRLFTLSLLF